LRRKKSDKTNFWQALKEAYRKRAEGVSKKIQMLPSDQGFREENYFYIIFSNCLNLWGKIRAKIRTGYKPVSIIQQK